MMRTRGFTLLELMIVVGIIALLAAIAYPAYVRYGYRARRVDGQELLLRIANAQERYYATNNKYGDLDDIGFTDATSEKGYYTANIPASASTSSQAFTVEAIPQGNQAGDACGHLSIDDKGDKLPDASNAAANSNGNCW
ncbi:MAG TPA: type IV pilin protein [Candidatus Saccharimonadales bacterium]|jgi:type IV pilus assembly protein PilE|nr:type IV pilin protein [Candidatus Saccharimonadales bacterium]